MREGATKVQIEGGDPQLTIGNHGEGLCIGSSNLPLSAPLTPGNPGGLAHVGAALPPQKCNQGASHPENPSVKPGPRVQDAPGARCEGYRHGGEMDGVDPEEFCDAYEASEIGSPCPDGYCATAPRGARPPFPLVEPVAGSPLVVPDPMRDLALCGNCAGPGERYFGPDHARSVVIAACFRCGAETRGRLHPSAGALNLPAQRRAIDLCACGCRALVHSERTGACDFAATGCRCTGFTPHPQPRLSPVHAQPTAGYADWQAQRAGEAARDATPEPIDDAPTARVLTPTDEQLRAERLLGLTATVTRLTTDGRWRARVESADRTMIAYYYGTCAEVFDKVRAVLEGRAL